MSLCKENTIIAGDAIILIVKYITSTTQVFCYVIEYYTLHLLYVTLIWVLLLFELFWCFIIILYKKGKKKKKKKKRLFFVCIIIVCIIIYLFFIIFSFFVSLSVVFPFLFLYFPYFICLLFVSPIFWVVLYVWLFIPFVYFPLSVTHWVQTHVFRPYRALLGFVLFLFFLFFLLFIIIIIFIIFYVNHSLHHNIVVMIYLYVFWLNFMYVNTHVYYKECLLPTLSNTQINDPISYKQAVY